MHSESHVHMHIYPLYITTGSVVSVYVRIHEFVHGICACFIDKGAIDTHPFSLGNVNTSPEERVLALAAEEARVLASELSGLR